MSQNKITTQKITGKISASIISASASTRLDHPLWAINWFDLKKDWLYALYNRLALGHVNRVGGYPVFKGELTKTLLSNERLQRDMLLIVRYPQAQAFLKMLSSKLFQLKSMLRTSSVRHFQFGFMQKLNPETLEAPALKYAGKLKFLIHVCENEDPNDVQALVAYAATKEVFPYFIGSKSAILGLQKGNGKLKTLDFMLSHVLVFSGFDTDTLETVVRSEPYQKFIQSGQSNFIGLYDRKI